MNNLIIEQSLSSVESISATIIEKLYELAKTSKVQNTSYTFTMSLKGNVSTPSAYEDSVTYLRLKFPELIITVQDNNYYIRFKDSKVEEALVNAGIGDSLGVSVAAATNATIGTTLRGNTEITSFDEFKYFTKDNNNPAEYMFKDCTNLESIDLSNITAISRFQFQNSGIKIVNAPNLTLILGSNPPGCGCFSDSQVEEVVSLGHISYIPDNAFFNCLSLESVVLPDECYELRVNAFKISLLYINSYGSILQSIQGLDHINNFGGYCMYGHRGLLLTAEDIKEAVKIDSNAFWYTSISSINCKKLSSLGSTAFRENTALTTVECLGTVNAIPLGCFSSDSNLQTVKLPYECISIGANAFYGCSALTSVTQYNKSLDDYEEGELPVFTDLSRIISFGSSCFERCSLLKISTSEIANATNIEDKAFFNSGLYGTLHLANLVNGKVNNNAFLNTQISNVILENITEIGSNAFAGTGISAITIPPTIRSCYIDFVSDTIVQELIFPEGVEELLGSLFATKNNSLTYIEIPSTVTKMDKFFHRSLLKSSDDLCTVVIKATTPPTLNYYGNETGGTQGRKFSGIYVPDSSLTEYQNGTNAWLHSSILAKLKPISQLLTDNPTAWAKYNRTSTV